MPISSPMLSSMTTVLTLKHASGRISFFRNDFLEGKSAAVHEANRNIRMILHADLQVGDIAALCSMIFLLLAWRRSNVILLCARQHVCGLWRAHARPGRRTGFEPLVPCELSACRES